MNKKGNQNMNDGGVISTKNTKRKIKSFRQRNQCKLRGYILQDLFLHCVDALLIYFIGDMFRCFGYRKTRMFLLRSV